MEAFRRYHSEYRPSDKVGIAFCAGANQSIKQFIHPSFIGDVYTWATVDDTKDTGPTVVGNARNHQLLRSLPQRYFDVVLFANCPYTVYGSQHFDRQWFGMIKRLVKPGGEIIFKGLPGLEGWWRYPDFENSYNSHFNKQAADIKRRLTGDEPTPYLDEQLEWLRENIDPNLRVEILPSLPWDHKQPIFLVIPV